MNTQAFNARLGEDSIQLDTHNTRQNLTLPKDNINAMIVVSSRLSVRLQGLLLRTLGPVPLERLTHDNAELYLCQPGRHNNVVNISRGPFWSVSKRPTELMGLNYSGPSSRPRCGGGQRNIQRIYGDGAAQDSRGIDSGQLRRKAFNDSDPKIKGESFEGRDGGCERFQFGGEIFCETMILGKHTFGSHFGELVLREKFFPYISSVRRRVLAQRNYFQRMNYSGPLHRIKTESKGPIKKAFTVMKACFLGVRVPTIAPLGLEVLFSNWGKLGHYVEELAKLGYRMNLVEAQIYGSCNSFESFRRGLIFHCSKNAWEERGWLHLLSEPEKRTQYFPGNKKRTFVLRARPRKLQPARSCPND
ncbi:hypothetical protein GEV33_011616 [Tenebrio molitor]|uniref:Uncharacterized protein n=1 Tax=Tenebrio molitor TaxID=7067 RepID=A0A8J6HCG3_TENMO|nr:hypothetical protein GEV33_011616 [Tenebrio molitor]